MTNEQKMTEIKKLYPFAKCSKQRGVWYVDGHDEPLNSIIAIARTEDDAIQSAYEICSRQLCK